ncbi:MAG: NUDIX hydrolase [Acidobacteriaceae bacterium]|nr:NUDIX hydrolase [Acidobacteriaceae bacterium]
MATQKKNAAKKTAVKSTVKKSTATAKTSKVAAVKKPLPGKALRGKAKVLNSQTVYQGKVFWVTRDEVKEPGEVHATRDVIRHNGSVVILAVDTKTNPKDPGILLIRQYRHAAESFLLELPAGRIEKGEKLIPAGKRELIEETGYRAKKWSIHTKYWASPGFLSEAMHILLAEDLTLGAAAPEDDERIELHMTPLSEVLRMIHEGKIHDGKTLIGVLLYASLRNTKTRR